MSALTCRTGAELVYRGDQVENQMFTIGSATGVQFHPEVTEEIIHDWCQSAGRKERDEIISQTSRHISESHQICRSLFTGFLGGIPYEREGNITRS